VTWINLNEGTAKPLSDSEAALRAKPLGSAGFPAPHRPAIYGLFLRLPQPRKPRGYAGLENSASHTFVKKLTTGTLRRRDVIKKRCFLNVFVVFEKHQLLRNILVF
jgi:hypothetical protein